MVSLRSIAAPAVAILVVLTWVSARTEAGIIGSHVGDSDPVSEGWSENFTGTAITTGPAGPGGVGEFNDTELAWRLNDDTATGRGTYLLTPSALEALDARSGGWQIDARIHVTDVNNPVGFSRLVRYIDESGTGGEEIQYRLRFGSDAAGNAIVELSNGGTVNLGSGGFHDYSLSFDPVTQVASLSIDGAPPALTTAGTVSNEGVFTETQAFFGATATDETGAANYAQVQITTTGTSPILAAYDMGGGSPASLDVHPTTTAGDLTVGPGLTIAGFSGSTLTAFARADNYGNTEAGAVSGDDYFSFVVSSDDGPIDLERFFADVGANSSNGAVHDVTWFVRSSIDNFTATLGSLTVTNDSGPSDMDFAPLLIDLTGPQFQGLTDDVEFRVYMYGTGSSNVQYARLDNVVVRGSLAAAVPEPTSAAMWLLVTGTVWCCQRRRRDS